MVRVRAKKAVRSSKCFQDVRRWPFSRKPTVLSVWCLTYPCKQSWGLCVQELAFSLASTERSQRCPQSWVEDGVAGFLPLFGEDGQARSWQELFWFTCTDLGLVWGSGFRVKLISRLASLYSNDGGCNAFPFRLTEALLVWWAGAVMLRCPRHSWEQRDW